MQVQHGAHIVFLGINHLFIICLRHGGKEQPFHAERWLDDIRYIFFARCLVEVFKALAARFNVPAKVIVGSVGNAPQLAPTEGEEVLEVCCRLGIEGKLCRVMVAQAQVLRLEA